MRHIYLKEENGLEKINETKGSETIQDLYWYYDVKDEDELSKHLEFIKFVKQNKANGFFFRHQSEYHEAIVNLTKSNGSILVYFFHRDYLKNNSDPFELVNINAITYV